MAEEKDTFPSFSGIATKLEPADYKQFLKLSGNKDFSHLRKVVENYILRRAYDLISGKVNVAGDEVIYLRGVHDCWKAVTQLVDEAEERIKHAEHNESRED